MKKRIVSIILTAILMLFVLSGCAQEEKPDNQPTSETTREITTEAMPNFITVRGTTYNTDSIEPLNLSYMGLTSYDIEPLRYMTNLTVLILHNNQISDISALRGLITLTTLILPNNQLSDISALGGLFNLKELILSGNQINDISALRSLTGLTRLNLNNNQISDISALSNLTNLSELYLYGNPLTEEQVMQLRSALPNCNILFDPMPTQPTTPIPTT